MPEDDMEIYKQAVVQAKNNQNVSPLVDDKNVPSPIAPSSQMGRDSSNKSNIEKEEVEAEVEGIEIEFSFFKCEKCNEWKNGESMYMVETNTPILIREEGEEEDIKTLKTEIQTWCANCILNVIDRYKKEKQENVFGRVEDEIARLKDERLKITRIQDKK
jgi:hypothetical protein